MGRSIRKVRIKTESKTIVVPAQEEGFRNEFIGNSHWYAIRISAAMKDRIKYIAAYQVAPISAVTHIAEIQEIKPYKNTGMYLILFKGDAEPIEHVKLRDPNRAPQGPIYVKRDKLLAASHLEDARDY